ncbi:MAG: tetratricopeptide repeat protein, partial [Gammaproteobacteria bacterium]
SRYDNDIFKANLYVSQTMFDVFSGTSSDPFPTIDAVQKDIQRYIGNGSDHILNMIRATAHYMFGNYPETITLLTAYKNNHPNQQADFQERGLWLMLADSLRKTDQLNKAIEIYEKVLVDYPAHPMTHYALAKAYIDIGDASAAEVALRVALKGWSNADEQFKEKIEAKSLLKLVTAENS